MPRPITKEDIKRLKKQCDDASIKVFTHPVLGIYILLDDWVYCYSLTIKGDPIWVGKETIQKRKLTGHPKKRIKQMLRDDIFSLDEMGAAEAIIAELSDD